LGGKEKGEADGSEDKNPNALRKERGEVNRGNPIAERKEGGKCREADAYSPMPSRREEWESHEE